MPKITYQSDTRGRREFNGDAMTLPKAASACGEAGGGWVHSDVTPATQASLFHLHRRPIFGYLTRPISVIVGPCVLSAGRISLSLVISNFGA
jgi:hypothetical protein